MLAYGCRRMSDLVNKLLGKLNGWGEDLVLMLPNLAGAIGILVFFWFLARFLSNAVQKTLSRFSAHQALNALVCSVVRFLIRVTGVVVALHILDLDKAATTFLAGAGIAGLAIGFAFQDLTANFIAGIAMALQRPAKVGDLIETNGYFGIVEAIEMRSSRIRTLQGPVVRIPNRKIFEESLTNYNDHNERRIDLVVGVSYGDDLKLAQQATKDAVANVEGVSKEPAVYFQEFGDSSINLVAQFWIPFLRQPDFLKAQSDAIIAIKQAFDKNNITIPFPIRTLDFGIVGGVPLQEQLGTVPQADK